MVKGRNVDESSKELIQTMISDQQSHASEIQPGDNAEFNFQKVHNNVKTKIIEQGNVNSLATDKIFGNRVFKDDLLSAIENGTYGELGLTEEAIQSMDPTPDNKISTEDAAQIVSGILQDNDMLKDYLTDYYVKAMEQNFYDSLNPDVRKAIALEKQKSKQTNNESTPRTSYDGGINIKGGVIKNGIFMPNKK
jgi:O-phosphoseryl-tRNA(Cys) synthetase